MEKQDSPVVELVVKSNGDLRVFCNLTDGIDAQVDHPLSDHVSNLQMGGILGIKLCTAASGTGQSLSVSDLRVGGAGPSDKASIISKGPGVDTHLYIVKLGVEEHKRIRSGERRNNKHEKQET